MKMYFEVTIVIATCFLFDRVIASPVSSYQEVTDNELDSASNYKIDLKDLEDKMYGVPSEETGKKLVGWHENFGVNPEELGEYAEGDILFPAVSLRSALRSEYTRWPNKTVHYMISPIFNDREKALIVEAMNDIQKNTCIRFVQRTGESAYVQITAGFSGCWSSIGYSGSRVYLNLQRPGCVRKIGTIEHELMHAMGFIHEQARSDRDNKVIIQWKNIKSGSANNFKKYSQSVVDHFGVEYDYDSVMHYSSRAFSANGQPTIIARGNRNIQMGQREGLSPSDIVKINRMYKCNGEREARQDKLPKYSNASNTSSWNCFFGMLC